MKKFYLESLGCPKNLVDSENFAAILQQAGFRKTDNVVGADIVFVNTCAFLQSSLDELEDVLNAVEELKREGQIGRVIVSGCVMNRNPKHFQEAYPSVDNWIGLKDFATLAKLLVTELPVQRKQLETGFHAYLRISDGCENFCSYCKIPSIRGKLLSVPIEQLKLEAQALAARPVLSDKGRPYSPERFPQELILIAQDSCLYGTDLYGRKALPELIEALHEIEGFKWIRLMYLHPDHFELDWLALFERFPRLLPYFEIPIQHVSRGIISAMHRQKSETELTELFLTIKRRLPQAALRTTLMTGFPGESLQDYKALQRFLRSVPLLHMGSFAFSAEDGTAAYSMQGQIKSSTALRRQDKLEMFWEELRQQRWENYVGQVLDVLIEGRGSDSPDEFVGRAWFQAPEIDGQVLVNSSSCKPGQIVKTEIDDVVGTTLFAHTL